MAKYIHAIFASFRKQLKLSFARPMSKIDMLLYIPTSAVLAWIVRQSGDQTTITYVMIGAFFMTIWRGVIFPIGWSISSEIWNGTLEFSLISRTPMIVQIFGRALAELISRIRVAVIASAMIVLIAWKAPAVANIPLLIVSLLFVVIGITASCLLLAPLFMLARGRPGFWNAILPFGTVLSCFLIPFDNLPSGLAVVSRLLPASWGMRGVWLAITGDFFWWEIMSLWGWCLATSIFMVMVAYFMFKAVEKRIRVTGTIGT